MTVKTRSGVHLLGAKRADYVRLAWTGGVPPHDLESSEATPLDYRPLASCLATPDFADAGVVGDGRLLFYRVIP